MLCYACCSVDFPHISVGCSFGNRWRLSSAPSLVQRHSLLVQKVAISKATLCVSFNTSPMAKPISIRPLVQRLKRLSSLIHHEPAFMGGWNWFSPQRVVQTEVKEDPPEHLMQIKITHPPPPSLKINDMNATWRNHLKLIAVTLTPDTCCRNLVINNNLIEDIHHQTSCKPLWTRLVWSPQGSKKTTLRKVKCRFSSCALS